MSARLRRMTAIGGPLAGHMALHILLMNFIAPLAALAVHSWLRAGLSRPFPWAISLATTTQLALLWGWHAPGILEPALHAPIGHAAMQLTLFLAAVWFWSAVLRAQPARTWNALFALLITGKLFCLLGVLLVFAPRSLYPALAAMHAVGSPADPLSDQQLAGLLMIVACPLTYVAAGVAIVARWIRILDVAPGPQPATIPQPSKLDHA